MRILKTVLWLLFSPFLVPALLIIGHRLYRWGEIESVWRSVRQASEQGTFCADMVKDLPPLVQRYFLHAIQPGTRLVTTGEFWGSGSMEDRPGAVVSQFTHRRILTPFVGAGWRSFNQGKRDGGLGYAYYQRGYGMECAFLFNLMPVYFTRYTRADITQTFRNRLMFEMIMVPAALLPQRGVSWEQLDNEHIRATMTFDGETYPITLRVDQDGRLIESTFGYWNCKGNGVVYRYIPSAQFIHEEQTIDGYTIPSKYTLQLWHNSEENKPGPIYHFTIERAQLS